MTIQIDPIGTLFATLPPDAPEGTQPEALPGYHVNTAAPVAAWAAQRVTPATPRRVFGGMPTVFYTFANQAAFEAAMATADLTDPLPVPQSVTRRQAKQALMLAGLLDNIQPAIDAIANPVQRQFVQIEWDDSQAFERNRPALIALATALGMTSEQLDALFITASGL